MHYIMSDTISDTIIIMSAVIVLMMKCLRKILSFPVDSKCSACCSSPMFTCHVYSKEVTNNYSKADHKLKFNNLTHNGHSSVIQDHIFPGQWKDNRALDHSI